MRTRRRSPARVAPHEVRREKRAYAARYVRPRAARSVRAHRIEPELVGRHHERPVPHQHVQATAWKKYSGAREIRQHVRECREVLIGRNSVKKTRTKHGEGG